MKRTLKQNLILTAILFLLTFSTACHPATITNLKANTDTVGMYEKYELSFDLTGVSPSNYNHFRPETSGDSLSPAGIDVRADIVTPSGKTIRVYGFYDANLQYLGNSSRHRDKDRWVPMADPDWKVRYAPNQIGTHTVTIRVTDTSGTTTSPQMTFNCIESNRKGFVQTTPDRKRFIWSDGSPFIPFGTMLPYGMHFLDSTVEAMTTNGMNFARKWLVNRDHDDIFRPFETWYSHPTDSSVARTGERSATRNVSGTGVIVDQSFIGVKPDTYYKAFAYFKTSSDFNGQVAVSLVEDRANGSTTTRRGNSIGGGQNWAYSEVIFKTATNAEMIHFKPEILSGSTGQIWVDDVGLYECDASGNVKINYNMVFNPSFEVWNPSQLRMVPLARFEHILKAFEDNNMVVQPTIFDYRLWHPSNPTGFYSRFYGDWWTDPENIAQQDRVLRYLVARYGHYRSLFAWELTNEMDSTYTSVRGQWIAGRANTIRKHDPYNRMITNSYWRSPGDFRYAQIPELDLNQVHYYINTEERRTGQGVPSWWIIGGGMTLDTNPSNAASGNNSLRANANGSTMSNSATVWCQPNKSYTLRYKLRTSNVNGQASVVLHFHGGSSPGSLIQLNDSGTMNYTTRTRNFTTGSTATHFNVILQLTGSSGTAWWDDVEIIDNTTGLNILYNGGFESPPFGDDEFEWGLYNTIRTRERYMAGANGIDKAWVSGEWGLMGADADLSYWARPNDDTKPRKDSTGIHVHNCLWAQFMASAALNTPTYWWMNEYLILFNLWHIWKGATTFASNLPFYDRRESVATDDGVDVRATSSNNRIRLLGQKDRSSGYFWIQNREHSWSRVVRENQSPTPTSAVLTIPGFDNGTYAASWYNTRTGEVTKIDTIDVSDGELSLSVSSLETDVAVIVENQMSSDPGPSPEPDPTPQLSITLSVDKETALPSETLTYTITYANSSDGQANDVEISLPIPAHTTLVDESISSGGQFDSSSNSVRWTISSIPSGGSGTCSVSVVVN